MANDPEILNELREFNPILSQLQGINILTVPEGYFVTFSDQLLTELRLNNIKDEDSNHLFNQKVPASYFEHFSDRLLKKIQEEDDKDEEVLKNIPKSNPYTVPEGYFENLSAKIQNSIQGLPTQAPARVINLRAHRIFKIAAAAMLGSALLIGGYFTINRINTRDNPFAVVNKKTVQDPAALKYDSQKKFDEGIASLSDDQIISYLEVHGSILENDQLTRNTDVSGMPDATDYLIDKEALDNYLEKINSLTPSKN